MSHVLIHDNCERDWVIESSIVSWRLFNTDLKETGFKAILSPGQRMILLHVLFSCSLNKIPCNLVPIQKSSMLTKEDRTERNLA
jgi:hypothetical protein